MKNCLIILLLITLIGCNNTATQPTKTPVDSINGQHVDITIKQINTKKTAKKLTKLVKYNCNNNKEITVSFISTEQKNIAIINEHKNQAITLAAKPVASGFLYSNGKYSLRGQGMSAAVHFNGIIRPIVH